VYHLRGSEARALATIGSFRLVVATDLEGVHGARDVWNGDLRGLADQGLIERKTVVINHQPTHVAVLTRDGKALLEVHGNGSQGSSHGRAQTYHAGLVKPRELAHDAQLFRLYQAGAERIEAEGGRVTRVVLDYELKRDYQRFLHHAREEDKAHATEEHAGIEDARRAFAESRELPIIDGHLELPDLRIEYQTADGQSAHRDLELVTEHYSRAQLSGKAQAGFALYRASAAGRGRTSSGTHRGGSPFDPHHLERLA
jgi:hypothetical protein